MNGFPTSIVTAKIPAGAPNPNTVVADPRVNGMPWAMNIPQLSRVIAQVVTNYHPLSQVRNSGRTRIMAREGYVLFADNGDPEEFIPKTQGEPFALHTIPMLNMELLAGATRVQAVTPGYRPARDFKQRQAVNWAPFGNDAEEQAYQALTQDQKLLTTRGVLERFPFKGVTKSTDNTTQPGGAGVLYPFQTGGQVLICNYFDQFIPEAGAIGILSLQRDPVTLALQYRPFLKGADTRVAKTQRTGPLDLDDLHYAYRELNCPPTQENIAHHIVLGLIHGFTENYVQEVPSSLTAGNMAAVNREASTQPMIIMSIGDMSIA